MRFCWIFLLVIICESQAQNYQSIKKRFDSYLNYHGNLNSLVKISEEKIELIGTHFIIPKKNWETFTQQHFPSNKSTPIKIMIDPGHIAGNMNMAKNEQKFLHFTKQNYPDLKQDSIDLAEGILTFQTATIFKKMLEEKGFIVALTRQENATSFGCTYSEWLKNNKKKILDSLLAIKKITAQKHKLFLSENPQKFFVDFFKDYELQQRAKVINGFHPDLTVIIHYNVDEKNTDWKKPSNKDYCMTFIPGCFTVDNLKTEQGQLNFLRLLLSNDLDESERISSLVVNELSKQLQIPVAKKDDATYLTEHCMSADKAGVYSRNLALCRMVQSPLVYGECLYQDSENECYILSQNTETAYGIKTNKRVLLAAQAFYNAILSYYNK